MTLEIGVLLAILTGMGYFFFTEKLPIEITAFLGLLILILGGFLEADEAFTGFASPAVITMLSVFFLSTSLLHTGVADMVGNRVRRTIGSREVPLIAAIMLVAGVLSAFMNNIAAAAVLLPAVASISRETGVSPSRLFMPLAFGAILGGTTTLVGTPPNILAGEILKDSGMEPFELFDFTPAGAVLLLSGIVYMTTVGRLLLPRKTIATAAAQRRDLALEYQLHEAIFTMRIPHGSELAGRSLQHTEFGSELGVQVVAIHRQGEKILAPMAHTTIKEGDILEVKGRFSELQELFRVRGVHVREASPEEFMTVTRTLRGLSALVVPDSQFLGGSPREHRFRERYGALVVGIRRGGDLLARDPAGVKLEAGDELCILSRPSRIEDVALVKGLQISGMGEQRLEELMGHVSLLQVPSGSSLAKRTIEETRIGELTGLTILGIMRGEGMIFEPKPGRRLKEGDGLLVAGDVSRVRNLLGLRGVQLEANVEEVSLESEEVGVVEATVAPRSRAAGSSLAEQNFRDKHGLQILAIWREGQAIHTGLAHNPLKFGDALLMQGPWNRIRAFGSDPDFLVLSPLAQEARRTRKAPFSILGVLIMVGLVVSGLQPIHVAAFAAAIFVILTRTITMEEAYRGVEWRAIFLVAAILPVGIAMERTGTAALLTKAVTSTAGPLGESAVMASLLVLSSFMSQSLDGAPTVVLLAPIGLQTADQLGINAHTIMMGISLAASAAFMTPFSHKANLLVMGAGGYRVKDYLRVGTPLTVFLLVLLIFLLPVLYRA